VIQRLPEQQKKTRSITLLCTIKFLLGEHNAFAAPEMVTHDAEIYL
jgi:hypothetical protein